MSLDTTCTKNWLGAERRWLRWAALPLLALLLAGAVARPAEAGSRFEDAFNREMGRIAAHEAVYVGRQLLGALVVGAQPYPTAPARAYPVYVAVPEARRHYGHGRGHYWARGHGHDRPHRHDRHCGHH